LGSYESALNARAVKAATREGSLGTRAVGAPAGDESGKAGARAGRESGLLGCWVPPGIALGRTRRCWPGGRACRGEFTCTSKQFSIHRPSLAVGARAKPYTDITVVENRSGIKDPAASTLYERSNFTGCLWVREFARACSGLWPGGWQKICFTLPC
jgi:hypothetical protein